MHEESRSSQLAPNCTGREFSAKILAEKITQENDKSGCLNMLCLLCFVYCDAQSLFIGR